MALALCFGAAAEAAYAQTPEREYREFADAMNKAGNKIARALKQYQDPGTSKSKRVDLQLYLERTAVTDPNDKKVLKGALLDPQYGQDIVASIQMALLHAIQRNPSAYHRVIGELSPGA